MKKAASLISFLIGLGVALVGSHFAEKGMLGTAATVLAIVFFMMIIPASIMRR